MIDPTRKPSFEHFIDAVVHSKILLAKPFQKPKREVIQDASWIDVPTTEPLLLEDLRITND